MLSITTYSEQLTLWLKSGQCEHISDLPKPAHKRKQQRKRNSHFHVTLCNAGTCPTYILLHFYVSPRRLRYYNYLPGGLLRKVVIMSSSSELVRRRDKYQKYFRPCCIQRGRECTEALRQQARVVKLSMCRKTVAQKSWSCESKGIW